MKTRIRSGIEIDPVLIDLAQLRIDVFASFPYLYTGTVEYEREYLRTFATAKDALVVTAETADGKIIGCATGSAITTHHEEFAQPLRKAGIDLQDIFYLGESVLLPDGRGLGLGHTFFDEREAYARERGYQRACFCAIERSLDHPQRPTGYSPLDSFWIRRGYNKHANLRTTFDWPEAPGGPNLRHEMRYWLHDLS